MGQPRHTGCATELSGNGKPLRHAATPEAENHHRWITLRSRPGTPKEVNANLHLTPNPNSAPGTEVGTAPTCSFGNDFVTVKLAIQGDDCRPRRRSWPRSPLARSYPELLRVSGPLLSLVLQTEDVWQRYNQYTEVCGALNQGFPFSPPKCRQGRTRMGGGGVGLEGM